MSRILQLKWVRGILFAALLVGVYALVGFKVAPGIVRSQAIAFVKQEYGRDLTIGEVRVNPFLLQLEIRDLSLPDADGSPMIAFRRLFVDFEVASLWRRAWTFKDVILEGPRVKGVIRPGGAFNLADLALEKGVAKTAARGEEQQLPSIWLQSLVVSDGAVGLVDRNRAKPFARRFAPVAFTLRDFHTTPQGGGFRLAANSEQGEGFEWKGRFQAAPVLGSQGDLTIHGLKAQGVGEYLGDALPFVLGSGLIDISGHYDVAIDETVTAKVNLPSITVTGLGVRARGVDADWVQVPRITITDTSIALPEQSVSIADISVADMQVQAWMAPDGSINLTQLFAGPAPAATSPASDAAAPAQTTAANSPAPASSASTAAAPAAASGSPEPAPAQDSGNSAPWKVEIAAVAVTNATIDFEDRLKEPAKKFVVKPLEVTVRGASLDLAKPVAVTVNALVNDVAPFKAEGTVTPEPLAADMAIALSGARMQILQPYVLPVADLTITDGRLTVEGKVRLDPPEAQGPDLRFDGDITIDEFASIDNALKQDLVKFKRVEVRKLSYAMGPDSVAIDRILVQQPFARVIISPERVINIAAVLDPQGTQAMLEAQRAEAAAEAALSPAEKRKRDRERAAAEKRATKDREASGTKAPETEPLPAEGMPIRVREVKIEQGTLDFTDNNVRPNFHARVQQLRGSARGLSSDPAAHAKVDFKGTVGDFSPVTIAGEIQPFAFDRYTSIGLKFENISLPIFNPYSGQVAGYAIAKGTLTTDLHYLIQDRKLDAQHHIRIDQLEWGEATATKGEATLPVKFATVLLRDVNGVINLDVPVAGTIDDPTFRIGPIIWQVIKNIIVKAVTAPFKLLGALFAGAEEAQFVDFAPGAAALDPATSERLGSLAKSLLQKPGLNIDVPVGTVPDSDGPALLERAYQGELAAAVKATLGRKAKEGEALPSFDTLEPEQQIDVLTALVLKQTGAEPQIPEPPEAPEGASRKEAKALRQAAEREFLQKEAKAHVSLPATALDELAEARATAVQHALLDGSTLEPTRVFLTKNGKVAVQDGKVRLQLELR